MVNRHAFASSGPPVFLEPSLAVSLVVLSYGNHDVLGATHSSSEPGILRFSWEPRFSDGIREPTKDSDLSRPEYGFGALGYLQGEFIPE
jgi:hypothetical protein